MNRILPILFTLLLAGCIGPRADRPVRADVPPMPPLTVDGEWLMADGPGTDAAPAPPANLRLIWDPSPDTVLHYNIYTATEPSGPWTVWIATPDATWPVEPLGDARYFKVNATGTNWLESDFAGSWK